jgi:hypothetical protein
LNSQRAGERYDDIGLWNSGPRDAFVPLHQSAAKD